MGRYLVRRFLMAAAVLLLLLVFLASVVHLAPGDPVEIILGPRANEQLVQQVRDEMGLDEPVHVQVWNFVRSAARGDLGEGFLTGLPVTTRIADALPHTIILVASSLLVAVLVGIPLGVFVATRPSTWLDRTVGISSIVLITMPSFVIALALVLLFAVKLDLLPAIGAGEFSDPLDYASRLILPTLALALPWIGYLPRLVRASMLDVLGTPYIRAARAVGLREHVIFYQYALKNALVPTLALLGLGFGYLLAGSVFVEIIFARPGLGTLSLGAFEERDWSLIRGTTLVFAVFIIGANLVTDLCYRFLDPRIRVEESIEAPTRT